MNINYDLYLLLEATAQVYHEPKIFFDVNQSYTLSDLMEKSVCFALKMSERGVKAADRIVSILGNKYQSLILFWAAQYQGSVPCLLEPSMGVEQLEWIMLDLKPKLVLCTHKQSKVLRQITLANGAFNPLLVIVDEAYRKCDYTLPFKKFVKIIGKNPLRIQYNQANNLALIIYTSGSTGRPKGVMLSHLNIMSALYSIQSQLQLNASDRILCVLPFSFDYGLYQHFLALLSGATLFVQKDFFWPGEVLQTIKKERITILPIVPPMIHLISSFAELKCDFKSLRMITSTGAHLSAFAYQRLHEIFSEAMIFVMYGVTESKRCSILSPKEYASRPNSVGRSIPGLEISIVNEQGQTQSCKVLGEVKVTGPMVMLGYWNNPSETNKRCQFNLAKEEMSFFTGDIGYLDSEGYLFLIGRKDSVFKSRGIKVSSCEIEKILIKHPYVVEVAVISKYKKETGTIPFAFIVLNNRGNLKSVHEYAFNNLSPQQMPTQFQEYDVLPRLSNGKIDRQKLEQSSIGFDNVI